MEKSTRFFEKVKEALKDSGAKALKRHALYDRPIVISVAEEVTNKYANGKMEKRVSTAIN
jgi:hypothetical protein